MLFLKSLKIQQKQMAQSSTNKHRKTKGMNILAELV